MTTPLVVAKAPVAGLAKTRLAETVGPDAAADLAAAAMLDTLDVVRAAFPDGRRVVALTGDLGAAARADELVAALADFDVVEQEGEGFGERLAHAHATVGDPTVQIGTDTPHLDPEALTGSARSLATADAVLGDAEDGGWWLLALRDPTHAALLRDVPMSRADTGARTRAALESAGLRVAATETTYDIDTAAEARRSAADAPHTRFARAWRELAGAE